MTEVSYEERFLSTLLDCLEVDDETELYNIINQSEIVIHHDWKYSGKKSNQRSAYVELKVPVKFKKIVATYDARDKLSNYCSDIYVDDDAHGFVGIKLGTTMNKVVVRRDLSGESTHLEKHNNYENLIHLTLNSEMSEIEKAYIFEACECAMRNNRIAAATMLGCAAEYLLLQLCDAYQEYLECGNGTQNEIDNFKRNVINAKSAYTRLDEFEKRVESKIELFKRFGFENPKLNFNFLDIIRQVRNASGHPTGKKISPEDLNTMFGNYQFFIQKAHLMIKQLPNI
ncbi:hypothetical protein Q5741_06525 [Paenibacillus sp. JX-17]|uniref:RiboL-PSP-HEPN domain-containing protein n=1 Tax=Paenibacillus lacisoli TaxID=3064525 RepID=A0ABT9CEP3_9BACL|nr:hypothetical protein [Paenibacillus sp. JX-17]MDO7906073.1 hypothetical protein [Paenibacillus sp. JX-17]